MSVYLISYYACVVALCVIFCVMFFILFMCLYLAYVKLDEVLSFFKNCPAVIVRIPLGYGGPWGKLMLIGGMSGMVAFPKVYLNDGGASEEDLRNLPASLKKWFVVIHWAGGGSLLAMFVLVGGLTIMRPYVVF